MIFYYYIIDKKIFCEKRVFYEKIGKMMSNIGYRSPFFARMAFVQRTSAPVSVHAAPVFPSHNTNTRACFFSRNTSAPPFIERNRRQDKKLR